MKELMNKSGMNMHRVLRYANVTICLIISSKVKQYNLVGKLLY